MTASTGSALLGAISGLAQIRCTTLRSPTSTIRPARQPVAGGLFQLVPEPAGPVLMGLAGLLIRRR
jgi:hypothetical protein